MRELELMNMAESKNERLLMSPLGPHTHAYTRTHTNVHLYTHRDSHADTYTNIYATHTLSVKE